MPIGNALKRNPSLGILIDYIFKKQKKKRSKKLCLLTNFIILKIRWIPI